MNENKDYCIEVVNLHESGFLLERYQRDLTIIQKLFLSKAYPIYNDYVENKSKNKPNKGTVTDSGFKDRYKQRMEAKRQSN